MGVVNHVFDRRESQFYDFNEQIFTRQFSGQKFIKINQIFTKFHFRACHFKNFALRTKTITANEENNQKVICWDWHASIYCSLAVIILVEGFSTIVNATCICTYKVSFQLVTIWNSLVYKCTTCLQIVKIQPGNSKSDCVLRLKYPLSVITKAVIKFVSVYTGFL